jgi:aspartate-semialdehyde dehydrogenase
LSQAGRIYWRFGRVLPIKGRGVGPEITEIERVFDTVAIVGATGAVGTIICQLLAERKFPCKRIKFLASGRSAGKAIRFAGRDYTVEQLAPEVFEGVDLAIGSTPDEVARDFAPWAVERGAIVVDESGYWRMHANVPLVVPEVNPDAVLDHQGLIASPNCSTTQMVVAMKPLHDAARIRRVVVSTYQATSGMGLAGTKELDAATRAAVAGEAYTPQAFAHSIAFNLIPQIGSHKEQGYTSEEMKMVYETRKIMGDDSIQVCPTCVRVPVANCHSESILVETEKKLSAQEARDLFAAAPGIVVVDDLAAKGYPMPTTCDGRDEVFVGRIREDLSSPSGLAFWCVSDNLRKGAATNAVQIAELLLRRGIRARGRGETVGARLAARP